MQKLKDQQVVIEEEIYENKEFTHKQRRNTRNPKNLNIANNMNYQNSYGDEFKKFLAKGA